MNQRHPSNQNRIRNIRGFVKGYLDSKTGAYVQRKLWNQMAVAFKEAVQN